jgi:hypothetical protein
MRLGAEVRRGLGARPPWHLRRAARRHGGSARARHAWSSAAGRLGVAHAASSAPGARRTCTGTGADTAAATPTPRPHRTRQRQRPQPPQSSSGAAPVPTPSRDAATPPGAPRAAGPRRLCVLSWCCGGCRAHEFGAGLSEVPAAKGGGRHGWQLFGPCVVWWRVSR